MGEGRCEAIPKGVFGSNVLVATFLKAAGKRAGRRVELSAGALNLLLAYDWPGNVRQLENAVYRAMVLCDGPYLTPHDFPAVSGLAMPAPEAVAAVAATAASEPAGDQPVRVLDERGHLRTLEDIERDLIQFAIETYAGHMTEVARRLGIGRSTLYRKVREQGLDGVPPEEGESSEAA